MESINGQISHIYRERNSLADNLANYVIDMEGWLQVSSFTRLPMHAKKILNIEKAQIPNLRIKTRQITLTQ